MLFSILARSRANNMPRVIVFEVQDLLDIKVMQSLLSEESIKRVKEEVLAKELADDLQSTDEYSEFLDGIPEIVDRDIAPLNLPPHDLRVSMGETYDKMTSVTSVMRANLDENAKNGKQETFDLLAMLFAVNHIKKITEQVDADKIDPDELEKFEKRVNETPPGPARKVAEQIVEALKKKMGH